MFFLKLSIILDSCQLKGRIRSLCNLISNYSNVLVFNRFQLIQAEEDSYEVVILKFEKFCIVTLKIKHNLYVSCNSEKSEETFFFTSIKLKT